MNAFSRGKALESHSRSTSPLADLQDTAYLIGSRAYAEFKLDSTRMYLGSLWWILEPLLEMIIYYIVFGLFLRRGGPDYIPFLLTGLIWWRLFQKAFMDGTLSLFKYLQLVRLFTIRKIIFPLTVIIRDVYHYGFSLLLLLTVLLIYGMFPTAYWLAFPLVLFISLIFIVGVTLPFAAVAPFLPDLHKGLTHALRLLFFLSGVLYSIEMIPDRYHFLLLYNPLYQVMTAFRDVLMYERWPNWSALAIILSIGIAGIVLGSHLLKRFDLVYAKRVVE